jgi:arylsulfatase A-like enzyme
VKTRLIAAAVIVCVVAGAAACGGLFDGRKPNVLFICVDTLRHDHLGYAGHDVPVSPNIDALAERGLVFTNAYSQAGWTLPAMATLFTGLYPSATGATDFHRTLSWGLPTLAGTLLEAGYDTRGFVSHMLLTPRYGLNNGFRKFDFSALEAGHPHDTSTAEIVTDLAIEDLDALEEPFFMWVHYFDPHFEYLEHEEWSGFGEDPVQRYDQEIAYTDRQIGRLLGALADRGMAENTVVIFTSDHGEEFGDHGGEYHYTSYEEVMRVPLVFAGPEIEPGTTDVRAQQIDMMPTVLAMLGVKAPREGLPGRDLLSGTYESSPVFMERDRPPGYRQRSVVDGDHKLMVVAMADTNQIPWASRATFSKVKNVRLGTYVFDLSVDPGETENIYAHGGERSRELLAKLGLFLEGEVADSDTISLDEETRAKLRALGYIQ